MPTRIPAMQAEIAELKTELRARNWKLNVIMACSIIGVIFQFYRLTIQPPPATGNNNNVRIGDLHPTEAPTRDYQTTAEFASRNNISERLVIKLIDDNRLTPPPTKSGRAWAIPADCRILPQTTAISRN